MYKKILVPVDGSAASDRGMREAMALAKIHAASIRLLHVVDLVVLGDWGGAGAYSQTVIDSMSQGGRKLLEAAVAKVRKEDLVCDSVLEQVVGGRVADQVLAQATQWPADLIVMGTHGRRGLSRLALGSDAELVVREATVPVLLVRSPAQN